MTTRKTNINLFLVQQHELIIIIHDKSLRLLLFCSAPEDATQKKEEEARSGAQGEELLNDIINLKLGRDEGARI